MAKHTKEKRKTESAAETLAGFGRYLCDGVISVYMLLVLVVLPLYNKGYAKIGTEKENFFLKCLEIMGKIFLPVLVFWLICLIFVAIQKKSFPRMAEIPARLWKNLTTTDKWALLYAVSVVLSYLFTDYRKEAFLGTASWRMGLVTQLGAIVVYFAISRIWRRKDWMIALILPVSAVVFFLGYMNRFGLCRVDREILNSSFISTIGNINWYCGYLVTVLFGGVYLLWQMEERFTWKKILLSAYVALGFASLTTQGSSSGIVAFVAVMFFLFYLSIKEPVRMECFWQEIVLFSSACFLTWFLRTTGIFSKEVVLEGITDALTYSLLSVIMLGVSVGMLGLVHQTRKRSRYPEKAFQRLFLGICIGVPAVIAVILLLTLINTLVHGALTPNVAADSELKKWVTFNVSWGSARGATWAGGARCFWEASPLHKIFGVGPDCMYAFLSNEGSEALQKMVNDRFGGNRLTNAHNEWLTILVDMGILGCISYAGMMITAIRDLLRNRKISALAGACGICVLAYTVNNMFSFQQVMNISTMFVILGIGGNVMQSEHS